MTDDKTLTTPHVMVVSHEASRTGAPKVAVHLLRALRSAGARTTIVHRWGGPLEPELNAAAHDSRREVLSRLRVALRRSPRTRTLSRKVERFAIGWMLDRHRPDIVWCNTVLAAVYVPAAAARGIPCIVYSHESRALAEPGLRRAGIIGEQVIADLHDLELVGCSTDTAHTLDLISQGRYGEAHVLHSPIDIDAVRANTAERDNTTPPLPGSSAPTATIVAVGKGNAQKGFDAFGAAAGLCNRPDVTWVWVGEAPVDRRHPAVTYLGEQPTAAPTIAHATVFVLPSLADSFPLVVLEAMALGRPIVASRLPGTVEQLAETGLFVEPGDSAALADAVEHLLRDRDLANRLGTTAKSRCEERWGIESFDRRVKEILSTVYPGAVR